MKRALRASILLACSLAVYPQPQPGTARQATALEPDWDISATLQEISAHASRLLPVLDQFDVNAWVARGASRTYEVQLQSSKAQAQALAAGARDLARNPEKLSAGLELLFRMQAIENMSSSLEEGARKYQNPDAAGALASLTAENGVNHERFQQYLVGLAAQREQEFQVMNSEAQRCRSILATQPPPASTMGKKK
jgi:hypothetical protein